ncbi:unnamed protein product [Malus baccata var. baccata]
MSGSYAQNFSPARALSPHLRTPPDVESQYLTELLAEHQKLGPFAQVVPICGRLLNQEIIRVSGMMPNQGFSDFDRLQRGSPSPIGSDIMPNYRGPGLRGWNVRPHDRMGGPQGMNMEWQVAPSSPSSYIVKRILRLDIPVDSFPNFNFVGRLLGPRGNSLKRVEASTGCRVYIRGKCSIRDIDKAKQIIEELLKPMDESQDHYKREQLRELAMLKSNLREESPQPYGSVSPFTSSGMKRAKTGL